MAIERLNAFANVLTADLIAPPMHGLADARSIASVHEQPNIAGVFVNPDDVRQKHHTLPPVPGAPPTTGLMQVTYDDQPIYDRFASFNPGPVRSFFRAMMRAQKMVRQP